MEAVGNTTHREPWNKGEADHCGGHSIKDDVI